MRRCLAALHACAAPGLTMFGKYHHDECEANDASKMLDEWESNQINNALREAHEIKA